MLRRETIEPHTLELLESIQRDPFFSKTRLVGGTSLALQYGHRLSIDLDFFGEFIPDIEVINSVLAKYDSVTFRYSTPSIFAYVINDVKVDFVNYQYKWIDDEILLEKIRLGSDKDVAAMKFSAICGRGSKKDFVDLFWLLKKYSISEMMNFYRRKFPDGNEFALIRSLTYFEDAENQKVDMLVDVKWSYIKTVIEDAVREYLHNEKLT